MTLPSTVLTDLDRRQLIMGLVLPNEGILTAEQRAAVVAAVRGYMADHGLKQRDVARQVGAFSAQVLSAIFHGSYDVKKLDDHLRELNNWLEADARRRATRPEQCFVSTRVAMEIQGAADLAKMDGSIALVVGPTGIGKTMVAHVIAEQSVGALYLRLGRECNTAARLRNALADLLKVHSANSRRALGRTMVERIYAKLRDSHRLLVLDEAHQVADDGLAFLRDLYDETHIPMLWLATVDLMRRVEADSDEDHGQMYSRIGMFVDLAQVADLADGGDGDGGSAGRKLFSRRDIKALYDTPKLKLAVDAVEYLHALANELGRGSLRRCGELLKRAARLARAAAQQTAAAQEPVTVTADLLLGVEQGLMRTAHGRQRIAERGDSIKRATA